MNMTYSTLYSQYIYATVIWRYQLYPSRYVFTKPPKDPKIQNSSVDCPVNFLFHLFPWSSWVGLIGPPPMMSSQGSTRGTCFSRCFLRCSQPCFIGINSLKFQTSSLGSLLFNYCFSHDYYGGHLKYRVLLPILTR